MQENNRETRNKKVVRKKVLNLWQAMGIERESGDLND